MKTMKLDEFRDEAKRRFGPNPWKWKYVCPKCKTEQSADDLKSAGVPLDQVGECIGHICIGMWTGAGSGQDSSEKGMGCALALEGLLEHHTLEVEYSDGDIQPWFELAPAPDSVAGSRA